MIQNLRGLFLFIKNFNFAYMDISVESSVGGIYQKKIDVKMQYLVYFGNCKNSKVVVLELILFKAKDVTSM